MKRRDFFGVYFRFFYSLLCFLPPSFYIPFVLPFPLLTSQVIAWDCSVLFAQCLNNKGFCWEQNWQPSRYAGRRNVARFAALVSGQLIKLFISITRFLPVN
jgi:putative flippase GtrA